MLDDSGAPEVAVLDAGAKGMQLKHPKDLTNENEYENDDED